MHRVHVVALLTTLATTACAGRPAAGDPTGRISGLV